MPAQLTIPQPNGDDTRIPRKRQARLDDNGEPAGVPASKKMRPADENGQKKRPAKKRPEKQRNTSHDTRDGTQEPSEPINVDSSDDEMDVIEKPEKPEEDDKAQLGVYLLSNKIVRC